VRELVRQVDTYGPWINTSAYSVPVYVVRRDVPGRRVTLDTWGPDLQAAFDSVPIPRSAQPALGTDAQLTVWQPSSNRLWEFWQLHRTADGWHARWGGEMDDVSANPGYFTHSGTTTNWGATATGLPLLGGLITLADLRRGYINHALAISLVQTMPKIWAWPAQRTDGWMFRHGVTGIPEGTRFRLSPSLDIAHLALPPLARMLAVAAQRYGIVVRDKAGAVALYGQIPTGQAGNPWHAAFGGLNPNQILAAFPWSRLQAVQSQSSCCWSP